MTERINQRDAVAACTRLLGHHVEMVERPGGRSRRSLRLSYGERSVIVTRRKRSNRAELEMQVLRALHAEGAPVPEILAYDGEWLIQQDLGKRRLSQDLDAASPEEGEALLGRAIESLAAIHEAGRRAGLERRVVTIGRKLSWLENLVATPTRIGGHLGIPAPALDRVTLLERLEPGEPQFIKWDARPGNAAVLGDGAVAWFDWEHSGCRNRLDDLAWLLGDEYVADRPDAEERLLSCYLPSFCDMRLESRTRDYLALFGTFHMCIRLALIIEYRGDGEWWDYDTCLAADKVGITGECFAATCSKAARWAERTPTTACHVPWFSKINRKMQGVDP